MTKTNTVQMEEQTNTVSFIVKFARPHEFEGKTYKEIDLSGLDDLTTEDLTWCEQMFTKMGYVDSLKEFNTTFCLLIAHRATKLPLEFFNTLRISSASKIKGVVSAFLMEAV